MKRFEDILGDDVYSQVWEKADDVIESTRDLGMIYDDVPEDLKDIPIKVMEIHIFPDEHKEQVVAFLNR